jgi:hypothetical protein
MKCPKCGYISFDYNQNCPKCKKSLHEQAAKMNLPGYKPAPPSLLGSLFDSDEDMEINFDDTNFEKINETEIKLPGLAEAVAEIDSDQDEIEEFSIDFDDFSIDGEQTDSRQESKKPDDADLESAALTSYEDHASDQDPEIDSESGFEFFDLSDDEDETLKDNLRDLGANVEADESINPLLSADEELESEDQPEGSEEEEIEFDLDSYRSPHTDESNHAKEVDGQPLENMEISFDPELLQSQFDKEHEDKPPKTTTPDVIDFDDISELKLEESSDDGTTRGSKKDQTEEDFTILFDDLDLELMEDEDQKKET